MIDEPEWLFPYEYMEVGESFFMPTLHIANAHYIIDETSKKVGVYVKCYTVVEDEIIGVRCWRIA